MNHFRENTRSRSRWLRTLWSVVALVSIAITCTSSASAAVTAIDLSGQRSCYLTSSGGVYCWGASFFNEEIGWADAFDERSSSPMQVPNLASGATAVSVGYRHACAVVNGGAWCWGVNDDGQLGDGTTNSSGSPVQVEGLSSGVTAVAAGAAFSCALKTGVVSCWGDDPLVNAGATDPLVPHVIQSLDGGVTKLDAGLGHACVVQGGAAKCWGSNHAFVLGLDPEIGQMSVPTTVPGLESGVTDISAAAQTCAIKSGGVGCWGTPGALGAGVNYGGAGPVAVIGGGASKVAGGSSGGCAIVGTSTRCWGAPLIGDGTNNLAYVPVIIPGAANATAISRGESMTCAVVGGAAKCWGSNFTGELGDGSALEVGAPKTIQGLSPGAASAEAGGGGSCAVVSAQAICWGRPYVFDAEYQPPPYESPVVDPTAVTGLQSGVASVQHFGTHGCAIVSGSVKCWGYNAGGQLGNLTGVSSNTPLTVPGVTGASQIDSDGWTTCAVSSGSLKCWGQYALPHTVIGSGVTSYSTGDDVKCVVVDAGAKCWGDNRHGELGNGSRNPSNEPSQVVGLSTGVTSVSAGTRLACAVVAGAVKCWGENESGGLGNGTLDDSLVPVQVEGIESGATEVGVGFRHACARVGDAIRCWGSNDHGQLGDGSFEDSSIPVVAVSSGATDLSVSSANACAVVHGVVKCWGSSSEGQFGTSTRLYSAVPVPTGPTVSPPPQVTIESPSWNELTGDASPTLAFDVETGSSTQCKIDEAGYGPCPSELPSLSDGLHRVRVRATKNGNHASDYARFIVDTTPPVVNITSPAPGSTVTDSEPWFDFDFNERLSAIDCSLDGIELDDCDELWWLPELALGQHTLVVDATDLAGNVGMGISTFTYSLPVLPPVGSTAPPKPPPTVPIAPRPRTTVKNVVVNPTLKLTKGSKLRKARNYVVRVGFAASNGAEEFCDDRVEVKAKFRKTRISSSAVGSRVGAKCVLKVNLRIPLSASGRKIRFTVSMSRNGSFAGFTRHRVFVV